MGPHLSEVSAGSLGLLDALGCEWCPVAGGTPPAFCVDLWEAGFAVANEEDGGHARIDIARGRVGN